MRIQTRIVTILVVVAVLVACAPKTPTIPRAENFAFIFHYVPCGSIPMHVLDTNSATLVYTPIGDTTSTRIVLQLSADELESIYQKAMSISFFEYPPELVVPEDQRLGIQAPVSSYQLSMTNGEVTHSVAWRDGTLTKPQYTKADQLRELMYLIEEIIQSYPEVQAFPEPRAGCA